MIPMWKLSGRLGNTMFQYAYLYSQMRKGLIPDVYVQDPQYFDEYRNAIKIMFGDNIPDNSDYVAIHIRRGDYVNNQFYVDLMETDYYQRAMAMFPNDKFMIFSDDIQWCERQDIFKDCMFMYGDEVSDLNEMAGCKAVIMANSSYSWWGSYLCKGTVVAPKEWYGDKIQRTKLLKEWIQI